MKEKFDLLISDWVNERVDNERTQTRIYYMYMHYSKQMPKHMKDMLSFIEEKMEKEIETQTDT